MRQKRELSKNSKPLKRTKHSKTIRFPKLKVLFSLAEPSVDFGKSHNLWGNLEFLKQSIVAVKKEVSHLGKRLERKEKALQ